MFPMSFLPRPTGKPGPGSLPFQCSRYGATPTFSSNEFLSSVADGVTGGRGTIVDRWNSTGLRSKASRDKGIQWDGEGARRRRLATLCDGGFGVSEDDVDCFRRGSEEGGEPPGDTDGDEDWGLERLVLAGLFIVVAVVVVGFEELGASASGAAPTDVVDGVWVSGLSGGVLRPSCS